MSRQAQRRAPNEIKDWSVVTFFERIFSARIQRLIRESFWIVIGQAAVILGALGGIRILTELMSPEQYGQLALGMTLATLVGQGCIGPLSAGAARFFSPAAEAQELKSYAKGVLLLIGIVNRVILLLLLTIVIAATLGGFMHWLPLIIASLVFATVNGYNSIANGIQNAARQRATVALHSGLLAWTRLGIAVVLILVFGVSSTAVIWGYALATIVILSSQYLFLRPILQLAPYEEPTPSKTLAWKRQIVSYSWPFAIWGVFTALHLASDRWALAAFSSQAEVGLFAVLFQLGYFPMAVITEMLVAMVSPILFQRAGNATSQERLSNAIQLNFKIICIVLLTTAIIFSLVSWKHQLIFRLLVAPEYSEVSFLLPWVTLGAGIVAAGHVLSLGRMSGLHTKGLILPKVITAVIGLLLNIFAAYSYGLEGIVFAQLVFSVIYFGGMFLQYLHHFRKLSELRPS